MTWRCGGGALLMPMGGGLTHDMEVGEDPSCPRPHPAPSCPLTPPLSACSPAPAHTPSHLCPCPCTHTLSHPPALQEKRPIVMVGVGTRGITPLRAALNWAPLQAHSTEHKVRRTST